MEPNHYDVLIIGAGIAGSSLAYALSTITSSSRGTPLRIGLLERSLAEPDRIVGELLQPGGVMALTKIGMRECLEGIDAVPVYGYCVVESGETVQISYPDKHEGRSFHHGRFIQALRAKAKQGPGVEVVEATASELIECEYTQRVIGVRATRKGAEEKEAFWADLVVIADGCFSNFRTAVMGPEASKSSTKSHFVGAILEDAHLPIDKHGTVALVKGSGPVLCYQISEHDTRILIDVKQPLPADLKVRIYYQISTTLLILAIATYPDKYHATTAFVLASSHPNRTGQRAPPPHAELLPPLGRARRATHKRGRYPSWRRVEHAAPFDGGRNDRCIKRRCYALGPPWWSERPR